MNFIYKHIGIGVEKEIYGNPYFSYHYGYKKLISTNTNISNIEKKFFPYFENINFNIIYLNVSRKGNFINFTPVNKNYEQIEKYLKIFRVRDANSFSFNLDDLGSSNLHHREIYFNPNLNSLNFSKNNLTEIKKIIDNFSPQSIAIGLDVIEGNLNLNNIHLELYPSKNYNSILNFLNTLKLYEVKNIKNFEKYFLNFKKFSHLKIKIIEKEIKNIKYYRSINVNLPDFYYDR